MALGRMSAVALLCALPTHVFAQEEANPENDSAFVVQAPENRAQSEEPAPPSPEPDTASPVYFPDEITPESVARARALARERAAEQEQLSRANAEEASSAPAQVSSAGEGAEEVDQLSDGDSARALAQLSPAERQVLLDAVEGTDICERETNIPAIEALCAERIETRSAEFAPAPRTVSAEERLLGEGLDGRRIANLETAINRLARIGANSDDFSNQVIASVALNNAGTLPASDPNGTEDDPTGDLSAETQQLVAAIVEQLSGN